MSQKINIVNQLTPALKTSLATDIASLELLVDPLKIPLTKTQEKGLLGVSVIKEAVIKAVSTDVMQPYLQTLPVDVTYAQFLAMNQEQIDTDSLIALLTPILAILTQHSVILRNNRMYITTQTLDNAKLLSKLNNALKLVVKNIVSTFYSRGKIKPASVYSLAVSAHIEIGGVKNGKPIVNTGEASFSFLNSNGDIADTITVYPGSSAIIPKGWSSIKIINLSAVNVATFNIYLK